MCNIPLSKLKDLIIYKFKLKTKLKKNPLSATFKFYGFLFTISFTRWRKGAGAHPGCIRAFEFLIVFKGLKSLLLLNSSPLLRCNLPSIWPHPNNSISETPGLWVIYVAQITSILFFSLKHYYQTVMSLDLGSFNYTI